MPIPHRENRKIKYIIYMCVCVSATYVSRAPICVICLEIDYSFTRGASVKEDRIEIGNIN